LGIGGNPAIRVAKKVKDKQCQNQEKCAGPINTHPYQSPCGENQGKSIRVSLFHHAFSLAAWRDARKGTGLMTA
jgi:hypothetical protein